MGSIFFHLRVVPTRIENKLKGHSIQKPPKLNYISQYVSLLEWPNFDAGMWFTVPLLVDLDSKKLEQTKTYLQVHHS